MFFFDPSLVFDNALCAAISAAPPRMDKIAATSSFGLNQFFFGLDKPFFLFDFSCFDGWPEQIKSKNAITSPEKSLFMYASPSPMSCLVMHCLNISSLNMVKRTSSGTGLLLSLFPEMEKSTPVGNVNVNFAFGGIHFPAIVWNMLINAEPSKDCFGSTSNLGIHGTTSSFPKSFLHISTAECMPSSWNPYLNHAPVNHVLFSPCKRLFKSSCALIAFSLNTGWPKYFLNSTLSSSIFSVGLSVTNTSFAPLGKFCNKFTQYVTHTESFSPFFPIDLQFQLAHALRFFGINCGSSCNTTSFLVVRKFDKISNSFSVAFLPIIPNAWCA
mmetsp:Transcript_6129/g.19254  ORF Transcript_6129/g.19254 Transcript_6129/m.19254 type:complete len:328 (-) Transcript_6129:973-1956(-)